MIFSNKRKSLIRNGQAFFMNVTFFILLIIKVLVIISRM